MVSSVNRLKSKDAISKLKQRDGFKCQIYFCKKPYYFDDKDYLATVDHVIPRSAGGTDALSNLVIAHRVCNNRKGSRLYRPDGTLEFRHKRIKKKHREPCDICNEGRNLGKNDICSVCGSGPKPVKYPRYMQQNIKECAHDATSFCWLCMLGYVERIC